MEAAMPGTWFVMIPPAYQNKSDEEKRLVDFRVEYTDPNAIRAVEAHQVINGSNFGNGGNPQIGEDLIYWKGPFRTEAQAKAAQAPRQQSPNPVNDAVNAAGNSKTLTGWTHNIEQWLIRGFEMLLGLGLIIVAVAKLAEDTPAGRAAFRVATAARIL
jgi:hypothetical protein